MSGETADRKHNSVSPCAACKLLRRKCAKDCVFAPYFPSDDPHKFATVHRVFGASNVNKMLKELPVYQRVDAVSSMVYEANARIRDPVYGCVGAIFTLQQQVSLLQTHLALAQAEVLHLRMHQPSCESNLLQGFKDETSPSTKLREESKSAFCVDVDQQTNIEESLWN